MIDHNTLEIQGHVLIRDPLDGITLLDTHNAIHRENMSTSLARALSNDPAGHIHEMHFGNGGSVINSVGKLVYLPTNTSQPNSDLYNPTYNKVVDGNSPRNTDPTRNNMQVRHIQGTTYTDLVITCTLGYNEPVGQEVFDNASNTEGNFVFDELGLKTFDVTPGAGLLVSHVVFHPVQKSLNRVIEVIYTIRTQIS